MVRSERCLIISPHFDDAVMSCGFWIERHPGSIVATVCSGAPGPGIEAIQWDGFSGFKSGNDASVARGMEDAAAVATLGAQQLLLGFLDGDYKERVGRCHEDTSVAGPFQMALETSIGDTVDELEPDTCLAPLGLGHEDHVVTGAAARSALAARPDLALLNYADLPYAISYPDLLSGAVKQLEVNGVRVARFPTRSPAEIYLKERAVDCYVSQAEQLGASHPRWHECLLPRAETFFRIVR